ncbi:hypothetical protein TRFO_32426 [Tritrichomonas foetus]|uniref:Protein kinase domain-containing protein n=1 Tax=Tritrichomonas foetus TaxID=1144522 RepID=A0A1J4JTA0_9EUKA|nr:hypothetical protein TRFO_32426 [Tritrichomonas foetus]|eukprot:OHT00750.1 hypothetical protein TRFO_32426 [Tritrichomonas foetus]
MNFFFEFNILHNFPLKNTNNENKSFKVLIILLFSCFMPNSTLKIAVLGEKGSGKTCFIRSYTYGSFSEKPSPTNSFSYIDCIDNSNDREKHILFLDTVTSEYNVSKEIVSYLRECVGAILIVDLTSKKSLEKISSWVKLINQNLKIPVGAFVVGSKLDITDQRVISQQEIQNIIGKHKCGYIEMSFKDDRASNQLKLKDYFNKIHDISLEFQSDELNFPKSTKKMEVNLSRFKVVTDGSAKLGSGAFGDVVKAKDSETGQFVAIKKVSTDHLEKLDLFLFRREIEIMSNIHNTFIIDFVGFTTKNPFCIVMDLAPNGTLFSHLHKGPASPWLTNTRRTIMAMGIAYGMAHMHRNKIIHRDLKSTNILIDENYYPKICDFGIAKFDNNIKSNRTPVGTPQWMAPEMLNNSPYNNKIDIYSYAMILYELITNQVPFFGVPPLDIYRHVVQKRARPLLPPTTPLPLKELVINCWREDPMKRPTFDQIFKLFATHKVEFGRTDRNEIDSFLEYIKKNNPNDFPFDEVINSKPASANINMINKSEDISIDIRPHSFLSSQESKSNLVTQNSKVLLTSSNNYSSNQKSQNSNNGNRNKIILKVSPFSILNAQNSQNQSSNPSINNIKSPLSSNLGNSHNNLNNNLNNSMNMNYNVHNNINDNSDSILNNPSKLIQQCDLDSTNQSFEENQNKKQNKKSKREILKVNESNSLDENEKVQSINLFKERKMQDNALPPMKIQGINNEMLLPIPTYENKQEIVNQEASNTPTSQSNSNQKSNNSNNNYNLFDINKVLDGDDIIDFTGDNSDEDTYDNDEDDNFNSDSCSSVSFGGMAPINKSPLFAALTQKNNNFEVKIKDNFNLQLPAFLESNSTEKSTPPKKDLKGEFKTKNALKNTKIELPILNIPSKESLINKTNTIASRNVSSARSQNSQRSQNSVVSQFSIQPQNTPNHVNSSKRKNPQRSKSVTPRKNCQESKSHKNIDSKQSKFQNPHLEQLNKTSKRSSFEKPKSKSNSGLIDETNFEQFNSIANLNSKHFKTNLKEICETLTKDTVFSFFLFIVNILKDDRKLNKNIKSMKLLFSCVCSLLKKPRFFSRFVKSKILLNLPFNEIELIDDCLSIVSDAIEQNPNCISEKFGSIFRSLLISSHPGIPLKVIRIYTLYAEYFDDIVNPWPFLDSALQMYKKVPESLDKYILLFYNLCKTFPNYCNERCIQCLKCFMRILHKLNSKALKIFYKFVNKFYSNEFLSNKKLNENRDNEVISIDFNSISHHLLLDCQNGQGEKSEKENKENKEIVSLALAFLEKLDYIECDYDHLNNLCDSLFSIVRKYPNSFDILLKIANTRSGRQVITSDLSFLKHRLPTYENTFRLYKKLAQFSKLNRKINKSQFLSNLFTKFLKNEPDIALKMINDYLSEKEFEENFFKHLSENGFTDELMEICETSLNIENVKLALLIFQEIACYAFVDSFLPLVDFLITKYQKNDELQRLCITVLAQLSDYPRCIRRMKRNDISFLNNGKHYFKQKQFILQNIDEYSNQKSRS